MPRRQGPTTPASIVKVLPLQVIVAIPSNYSLAQSRVHNWQQAWLFVGRLALHRTVQSSILLVGVENSVESLQSIISQASRGDEGNANNQQSSERRSRPADEL